MSTTTTTTTDLPVSLDADVASGAPAELVAAMDGVEVDRSEWTARVGAREIAGGSPRDLRMHLVGALYEVFHAGRAEEKDLGRILREPDLEQALAAAIPHTTSPRGGRLLGWDDSLDGPRQAVVDLGEVRVRIPVHHIPDEWRIGEVVALDLPAGRPALSHGFFMVDGPVGMPRHADGLRRVYVHARDPEAAAPAWRAAMEALNAAGAAYRTKTLSHRDGYPRRDSIVFYLPPDAPELPQTIADAVDGMPGISPDTSLFAERLAPGVAIADDPGDPRAQYKELSFGEHRATIAANAIVRRAESNGSVDDLAALFVEECAKASVVAHAPAFNAPTGSADAAAVA